MVGKEIITNMFAVYILLLIGVTFFPIEIRFGQGFSELKELYTFKQRLAVNIIPFKSGIKGYIELKNNNIGYFFFIKGILGNIILLSPFVGYLLMYKKNLRTIKNVTITTLLISLSIELLQLLENITYVTGISIRIVDINDLILNTIGGVLTYYIFKMIYKSRLRTYLDMN